MRRRRASSVALALLAVVAGVGAAGVLAAESIRPAAGAPDPRQMVVTAGDLAGARVTHQGYYKDKDFPSVISYSRELENGRYRGTRLLYLGSEAEVGLSAESTAQYLVTLRRALGTKQGRAFIARSFESSFPKGGLVSNVQVGRPRTVAATPGSFDLLITMRLLGLRTEVHVTAFAVERVLGGLLMVGVPGTRISLARVAGLANLMTPRMTAQLTPANTALPVISGTVQDAQTLTASAGTWRGAPTAFAYQWQRCDPAGANCVDIQGATAPTYLLTAAEVGSTIRVSVSGQNAVAAASAVSVATPVVLAVPVPAP
jgi:hypothetical protein